MNGLSLFSGLRKLPYSLKGVGARPQRRSPSLDNFWRPLTLLRVSSPSAGVSLYVAVMMRPASPLDETLHKTTFRRTEKAPSFWACVDYGS